MKQFYTATNFHGKSLELIAKIDAIVEDYIRQGYRLTVRQLYYQLVARGIIENTERSYKNTTQLVNDARLAGMIDWDAIEDRTREFRTRSRWDTAVDLAAACANQFHMDMWAGQNTRVFVIVEKEALAGVLDRVCHRLDVPMLAARGYPSATVLREFVEDAVRKADEECQKVRILHLGDHDPSGIDMTRDLGERIQLFAEEYSTPIDLSRIALTMKQVQQQKPPPNPAKITDSRFADYRKTYGDESWELDALSPQYLDKLLDTHIWTYIDEEPWEAQKIKIAARRDLLTNAVKFVKKREAILAKKEQAD